ncbi:MAG: Rieske 2Fe-2S domain-containing protein [Polyangiales bacterium]
MTPSTDQRFPFAPYPNGWIGLAYSHELKRGDVRAVTALGRRMTLFRGQDGAPRLVSAYCPHLGADLGVGGSVVDNTIRCPFHGWRFDGSGACTHIDYAPKIPPKARLDSWPVRDLNGFVMLWHDSDGRAPWFELPPAPELDSDEWTAPRPVSYTIKTRWREILENAVDSAHFQALHRYPEVPTLAFRTDGPRFYMTSHVPWTRFGRKVTVQLDIESHGPCFGVTRGVSELPFIVFSSHMPIDANTTTHRMLFVVSKRVPLPFRELLVRLVIRSAVREYERDIPIWENKICIERPVLCGGDGPIIKFRSWAKQFYGSKPGLTVVTDDVG